MRCEFAVLHHVPDPDSVLEEMLRVSRRAVFLSDDNRFGHGRLLARLLKVGLYKTRLWPVANYVNTMGRGYTVSDGDGLAYSYSVFDSLSRLAGWADRVVVIPTAGEAYLPLDWPTTRRPCDSGLRTPRGVMDLPTPATLRRLRRGSVP